MDSELNDRLNRIEKMVNDNNRMLSKMRQAQKNAAYLRIVYWLIVLVLFIASFYFIQPYLSQLGSMFGIGSGSTTTSTSSPQAAASPSTASELSNLLKQYQSSQKTTQ